MLTAKKLNKEITIEEEEKDNYLAQGFDVYDGAKLIGYGAGKTVPYAKYHAVMEELQSLKKAASNQKKPPSGKGIEA